MVGQTRRLASKSILKFKEKKQNIYIWNMNKLKQMISEQYCSFGLCGGGGGGGVSRLVWPVITAVLLFLMRNVILV